MSTNACETLRNVKKGRTDWKVKCRVIREWKGVSLTGEIFKGWNLLLLDAKNCRMQAYIPASMSDRMARVIELGKIYLIRNFEVKEYLDKDKFRVVQSDRQIIFTIDTKLKELPENEVFILQNTFDFYQFADLNNMATQFHNLVDVVGIIQDPEKLTIRQSQQGKPFVKFKLFDGRMRINVTFWNTFAGEFEAAISNVSEEPKICIVASGRVTKWKDEIDICNYSATKFFLNYDHHSVHHLRKLSREPNFNQSQISVKRKTFRNCTVQDVNELGPEFIEDEVICRATINFIDESKNWKIFVCTSCYNEIEKDNDKFTCNKCRRVVPYPNKRFKVHAAISDSSGWSEIILFDREVRTLLGRSVFSLEKEDESFPPIIKSIQAQDYTLKIFITKGNIEGLDKVYEVNGIFRGWKMKQELVEEPIPMPIPTTSTAAASGSSYHLDEISQLNYDN